LIVRENKPSFELLPAVDVLDGQAVRLERGAYDRVAVDGGDPFELIARVAATHPPLVHVVALGAARDGTMAGPDLELIREVRAGFGGAVLAAGGIRNTADVDAVRAARADGAVVGRALLEGSFGLTSAPG
jgi:phosphoribosylformimino-5-aminoimidazole carboxamide ribonucleotide (ProFAR) isomerase